MKTKFANPEVEQTWAKLHKEDHVIHREQGGSLTKAVRGKSGGIVADFVISTQNRDRDQDTIQQKGWDLEAYLKNPVVLFAHNQSELPVARGVKTGVSRGALRQKMEFTPADLYPFGNMVGEMVLEGFLNASSVGFGVKEWKTIEEEGMITGFNFIEQELYENSIVPVPSNREALVEARSLGIDMAPMVEWAEKMLDGENRLVVPRDIAEEIRAKSSGVIQIAISPGSVADEVEWKLFERSTEGEGADDEPEEAPPEAEEAPESPDADLGDPEAGEEAGETSEPTEPPAATQEEGAVSDIDALRSEFNKLLGAYQDQLAEMKAELAELRAEPEEAPEEEGYSLEDIAAALKGEKDPPENPQSALWHAARGIASLLNPEEDGGPTKGG